MNSEIHIKKPPLKVYITIGLFATAVPVLIVSMILMPDVWRVVLYVGAGLFGLRSVVWIAKQSGEISHRNRLYEIEEKRARYLPVPASHNLFDVLTGLPVDLPDRRRLAAGPIVDGEAIERRRSVFDLIVPDGPHFSLIGGTRSGKTTLANHLLEAMATPDAVVYTLDPHAKKNTWSPRCQVFSEYEVIGSIIEKLFLEMRQNRYQVAHDNYPPIIAVLDEWPSVVDMCENAEYHLMWLAREGIKVKIHLILLAQADLVGDTWKNSSVRENFIKIAMQPDLTRQNLATIRHWDRSTELIELAGTYGVQGRWFGGQPAALSLPEPEPEQMTDEERRVVEMSQAGENRKAICEALGWTPGGKQYKRIDDILARWG